MKVRVMQLGEPGEGLIVPRYEAEVDFSVELKLSSGFSVEIKDIGARLYIRSKDDSLVICPVANNTVIIERRE